MTNCGKVDGSREKQLYDTFQQVKASADLKKSFYVSKEQRTTEPEEAIREEQWISYGSLGG